MVFQNCPALSQNLLIFVETVVDDRVLFTNLKIVGLSKLLNGSLMQTLKKH